MEQLAFPLEVKALTEEGTFEGWAAVFGNVDQGGDRIEAGAFAKTLKKGAGAVRLLWNHDPGHPIGVWDALEEKDKGLFGRGRFVMEVAKAKEVHALAKAGAIGGLSVGYRTVKSMMDGAVRVLKEVELWEVSLVTFPMNLQGKITAVKAAEVEDLVQKMAAGDRLTLREFEVFCKAQGMSNSQAERAARVHLKGQGEPASAADRKRAFLRALQG